MLQGLPLLSTAEQLDEVSSFLAPSGPAADVPPLIKARWEGLARRTLGSRI